MNSVLRQLDGSPNPSWSQQYTQFWEAGQLSRLKVSGLLVPAEPECQADCPGCGAGVRVLLLAELHG